MIDHDEHVHSTTRCTRSFVLDVICSDALPRQLIFHSNGTFD
jgi:hypothetical protein